PNADISRPASSKPQRFLLLLVVFLALSAVYLYPFPQANVFYPAVVLLHAFVGILATVMLVVLLIPLLKTVNVIWKAGWLFMLAGTILGAILIRTGTPHSEYRLLYAHIVACVAGVGCLLAELFGRRSWISSNGFVRAAVCFAAIAVIGWAARY